MLQKPIDALLEKVGGRFVTVNAVDARAQHQVVEQKRPAAALT